MTIKYGFLPYDEAKKPKETEVPKKLFDFNVKNLKNIPRAFS